MAVEDNVVPRPIKERRGEPPSQSSPSLLSPGDRVHGSTSLSSQRSIQNRSSTPSDSWDSQESHDFHKESLIWEKKVVLSCGGGGPRGLYQLYLLKALMDRVEFYELSLDEKNHATSSTDSPLLRFRLDPTDPTDRVQQRSRVPIVDGIYLPCHYFDYIGGTSVGGIIAVMLGRLRMSVDEAIKGFKLIWVTMAATMSRIDRIIPLRKAKKSNSSSLDRAFRDLLSERKARLNEFFQLHISSLTFEHEAVSDEFASDPELCKTIVIAMPDQSTSRDGLQRPCCFTTYEPYFEGFSPLSHIATRPSWADEKGTKVLIRDVCKATAAARGAFKGVLIGGIKFRDGEIWTANPAFEIFSEIETRSNKKDPIQLLVSLGSGPKKVPKFHTLALRFSGTERNTSVDQLLKEKLGSRYCHFEGPRDLPDIEVNEWRIDGSGLKTFQRIQRATENYCNLPKVKKMIDQCARNLVKLRQSRAKTAYWERFALGIRYTCRHKSCCNSPSGGFDDVNSFMSHLMWEHDEPPQDETHWNYIQDLLKWSQTTTVK